MLHLPTLIESLIFSSHLILSIDRKVSSKTQIIPLSLSLPDSTVQLIVRFACCSICNEFVM